MKVIVINGHAQSGKSTFVSMCKSYPNVEVYEVSMVDAIKEMAKLIGWNESQKTPRDRKFLSDLKDLVDIYNDGSYEYVKHTLDTIADFHEPDPREIIVFVHARNIEDIDRLVNDYNARTLVIRRKFAEQVQINNRADTGWWAPRYDYSVSNNESLDYLEQNSKDFMKHILSEDWGYGN